MMRTPASGFTVTRTEYDDPSDFEIEGRYCRPVQGVEDLVGRIQHEVDKGLLPGAQIAFAREGEVVALHSFGEASPGIATTDSTRFTLFSTTKPLVASALWLALSEAGIGYETPVAAVFPAFADNGKQDVTIEQVLLHTCGFPSAPMGPPTWFSREQRQAKMASWRLNYEPGTQCQYHASAAHWVLAELLDSVTGIPYTDYIEQRITGPLGLPRLLGIPTGQQQDIAEIQQTGHNPTQRELAAILGQPTEGVPDTPIEVGGELDGSLLVRYNDPDQRALGVPGAGGIGTAADMALFYQALLHNPGGLWPEDVLKDATTNIRTTLVDPLRQVPALRTAGLMLAGDDGEGGRRGFGNNSSPGTFGHDGVGGQLAWADPETGLSFCFVVNALERNLIVERKRSYAVAQRAAAVTP